MHDTFSYVYGGSGVARLSGLGGHTYRWVSAARIGEDKKRSQLSKQKVPICSENIALRNYPLFIFLYTTAKESRRHYFSKVGWACTHLGPPLAMPLQ